MKIKFTPTLIQWFCLRVLLISTGLIFIGNYLSAQNFTAVASGNWNSNATWGTPVGVYPGAAAGTLTVTIPTGFAVTLNVSPANPIGALAIAVGNGNNTLTVSDGFTLNVTGGIVITGAVTGGGGVTKSLIMNGTSAVVNCASLTLVPGNADDKQANLVFNGGTINVSGTVTASAVNPVRTQINFNGGGTLNVDGGTGDIIGGQITVGGSGTSTINADPVAAGNVIMNNAPATLDVNGLLNVSGTLTLTAGKIDMGPNSLVLSNATPASQLVGGNSTSYAFSTSPFFRLSRQNLAAATNYAFPVGTPADYMPVIVNTAAGASEFSISVYSPATTDGSVGGPTFPLAARQRIVDAMWLIDRFVGSGNTTVTIQWADAVEGAIFATFGNSQIGISRNAAGSWLPAIATTANAAANTVTATFNTFSSYGVGQIGLALPLRFGSVNAYKKQSGIQLDWKVYSENKVKNYEVERSADARSFTTVGSLPALYNNFTDNDYGFFDATPLSGTNYYRIKNNDLDGKFSYSSVIRINYGPVSSFSASITPNPVGSLMNLTIEGVNEKENLVFEIININGKIVHRENIPATGTVMFKTLDRPGLRAGLYFYKITRSSNNETFTGKLVLQ